MLCPPETEAFLVEVLEHVKLFVNDSVGQRKNLILKLAGVTEVIRARLDRRVKEVSIKLLSH